MALALPLLGRKLASSSAALGTQDSRNSLVSCREQLSLLIGSQSYYFYLVSISGVEGLEDSPQHNWVELPPGDGESSQHAQDESVEIIIPY